LLPAVVLPRRPFPRESTLTAVMKGGVKASEKVALSF
jgi:hypothetical protein